MAAVPPGFGERGRTREGSPKLTLCQPVTVFSSHRLTDLLSRRRALSLLSPSHLQEFHLLFVEGTALSLQLSPRLNPATLLPTPTTDMELAHSCPEVLDFLSLPLAPPLYVP